jgi:hypothetical protein
MTSIMIECNPCLIHWKLSADQHDLIWFWRHEILSINVLWE